MPWSWPRNLARRKSKCRLKLNRKPLLLTARGGGQQRHQFYERSKNLKYRGINRICYYDSSPELKRRHDPKPSRDLSHNRTLRHNARPNLKFNPNPNPNAR